jgi:uncharacterized protein
MHMNFENCQLEEVRTICTRYGVQRLALFGSFAHGTPSEDSDVDLLIEFSPGHAPGLFQLARIAEELSPCFGGRPIDLRTLRDLSQDFRHSVLNSSQELYAA